VATLNQFMMKEKLCLDCGSIIQGRSDKKFCSDHCRSHYFFNNNSCNHPNIKQVNKILRSNFKILCHLHVKGQCKVKKNKLLEMGFNFNHFTHIKVVPNNHLCFFSYLAGYVMLDEDSCLILNVG